MQTYVKDYCGETTILIKSEQISRKEEEEHGCSALDHSIPKSNQSLNKYWNLVLFFVHSEPNFFNVLLKVLL